MAGSFLYHCQAGELTARFLPAAAAGTASARAGTASPSTRATPGPATRAGAAAAGALAGGRTTAAGALPTATCPAPASRRGFACRSRAAGLGAGRCRASTLLATLPRRASVGLLAAPRAALLPSSGLLIHRSPGAPLRFTPRNSALHVALLDLCGLPLLLVCIRRLVALGHGGDLQLELAGIEHPGRLSGK
jgi:hypothetical protein